MRHGIAIYVTAPLMLLCLIGAHAAAQPRSVDLAISNGELPQDQRLIAVSQGDEVTLRVTSDKPVELHLHGYDIEEKLSPGVTALLHFTARATGRFPIELHGDRRGDGKVIGYLEVRPR
jgi:FtsP/CotA-like multicopper oxidase with cupredoxin domain